MTTRKFEFFATMKTEIKLTAIMYIKRNKYPLSLILYTYVKVSGCLDSYILDIIRILVGLGVPITDVGIE